jgi:hypothetical protein
MEWLWMPALVAAGLFGLFYFVFLGLMLLGIIGDNAKELLDWMSAKIERR